ncbi:MAG TPA: hypothetical protein VMI72_15810 [Roseiarcus sp.]|nr:hypothetical protein [Roseiarcus sp.]
MSPETFALAVAVAVFAAGLLGLVLQRLLPEHHTTGPSRDMIGAVVGLLTLLCALVASLLIWTAYGVYAGQNAAVQTLAGKVLQLDIALADYGPESNAERAALRERLAKTIDQVWGARESDSNFARNNLAAAIPAMRDPEKVLGRLEPSTNEQKRALATATSAEEAIGEARMKMSFALSDPVSYPLLLTVVGWVALLFCGYGLTSRGAAMPVFALAVGAVAIATAVLMILELSNPYSGVFRTSPAPLQQVLAVIGKE